ncbi:MAG: condensation domain-containing protein, partial [Blastocatellia bacterium]
MSEPTPFRVYAQRTAERHTTERSRDSRRYWLEKFADGLPALELPADRGSAGVRTFSGDRIRVFSNPSLNQDVKRLCVKFRSTMFTVCLAAFQILLHRLSGQRDIVVGTPSAGQSSMEDDDLVGFCLNELIMRSRLDGDPSFGEYLTSVRSEVVFSQEHQSYSLEELLGELEVSRSAAQAPPISAVFILERSGPAVRFFDLDVEMDSNSTRAARVDLHMNMIETDGPIIFECAYSTDVFQEDTIRRWIGYFETLLENIAANPESQLSQLSLLTDMERNQLLLDWNSTFAEVGGETTISKMITAQVMKAPDVVAIRREGSDITYGELNRRSGRLASRLRRDSVAPETVVAVCLERGAELVIALVAIGKAGGVYLPVDPTSPHERLRAMVEQSNARVVITSGELKQKTAGSGVVTILIDDAWDEIAKEEPVSEKVEPVPEQLAYIIYTSGATGTPKGVAVSNGAIRNHVAAMVKTQDLSPDDIHMQFISPGFDASIEEILPTLVA